MFALSRWSNSTACCGHEFWWAQAKAVARRRNPMLCLRRLESLPLATVLAGQTSRCLYLQLRDHQEGRRTHEQMTPMAAGLPRDDMRELGDYFAKQKLSPQPFTPGTETAQLSKLKTDETLCTLCQSGGFAG